jgi:hypothetical protein
MSDATVINPVEPEDPAPLPRMAVKDHALLGRKVAEWAKDPASRPKTVTEFRQQLLDVDPGATIPDRITGVLFVQPTWDTLVVRLPTKELIEESERNMSRTPAKYKMPDFYSKTSLSALELLYSRIGDYTISECK